jgi:hypothetical protein
MCTVLIPPGGYAIAVKYIISYDNVYFVESTTRILSPLKGSVYLKGGLLNEVRGFFGFDTGKSFRNKRLCHLIILNRFKVLDKYL